MAKQRQLNFEVLRVLVMFFIVVWHFIVHGMNVVRTLSDVPPTVADLTTLCGFTNWALTSYVAAMTSVATNCYVLITGYFLATSTKSQWGKVGALWVQKAFYAVLIVVVMGCLRIAPLGVGTFVDAVNPLSGYWFVGTYIGLMLIAPYLSPLCSALPRRAFRNFLLCFTLVTFKFPFATFDVSYISVMWFVYLYFVGAYIRLHNPLARYRGWFGRGFLLYCVLLMLFVVAAPLYRSLTGGGPIEIRTNGLGYSGPGLFASLLLFLWAKHVQLPANNRIVRWVASLGPYTLGVYLIHENADLRRWLWGWLRAWEWAGEWWLLLALVGVSVSVFLLCAGVDSIRARLFRALRVDDFITYVIGLCHLRYRPRTRR